MYIPTWLIFLIGIFFLVYYFKDKNNRTTEQKVSQGFTLLSDKKEETKLDLQFAPFRIQIFPNWYVLLKDHKLIEEKTWKQLQEKMNDYKNSAYNVLKNGISFTVLTATDDVDLIYNNNHCSFHSDVDFSESIDPITISSKDSLIAFSPRLQLKSGIEGYELGITTLESSRKVLMVGDRNDFIKLTVIPYSLFSLQKYKFGIMEPEQIAEQLEKNGLSKDKSTESLKSDVLFSVADQLNHKYFTIYYQHI